MVFAFHLVVAELCDFNVLQWRHDVIRPAFHDVLKSKFDSFYNKKCGIKNNPPFLPSQSSFSSSKVLSFCISFSLFSASHL